MTHWDFSGKVVLITGGGSGIGRAAALLFAGGGARVVIADYNEDGARETAGMIADAGGEAATERIDVTLAADTERMVAATVERFERIDYAVNSAGIGGSRAKAADYEVDEWRRIVDVNLTGVWLSMKYEIPAILRSGGGAIVNLSSVAGVMGYANHTPYGASKHGVIGLTRAAALEYAKRGLRINAVCPAFTRTPMVERLIADDPEREAKLAAAIPIGRLGTVDEVASSIAYLCTDGAAFITGQSIVLDGGLSIG
jgi:NAD(P)-dependent dehydrogenase (short-subunit alcohol dehydrogenase family)